MASKASARKFHEPESLDMQIWRVLRSPDSSILLPKFLKKHGVKAPPDFAIEATQAYVEDEVRRILETQLTQSDQGTQESAGMADIPQKRSRAEAGDGDGSATSALELELREVKKQLEETTKQRTESKHEYGFPRKRGKVCGVCASKCKQTGDERTTKEKKGGANWACFTCQVFLCSWTCLNEHNKCSIGITSNTRETITSKQPAPA